MKSDLRMSKQEMIERTLQGLEKFDRLPWEERWRMMIEYGTIDENGEVLLGPAEEEETPPPSGTPERP